MQSERNLDLEAHRPRSAAQPQHQMTHHPLFAEQYMRSFAGNSGVASAHGIATTTQMQSIIICMSATKHLQSGASPLKPQQNGHHSRKRSRSATPPSPSPMLMKRRKVSVDTMHDKRGLSGNVQRANQPPSHIQKAPVVLVPATPEKTGPRIVELSPSPIRRASTSQCTTIPQTSTSQNQGLTASHSRVQHSGKLGIPDSPTSISVIEISLDTSSPNTHATLQLPPVMHIDLDSDSGFDEELCEVSQDEKPNDELDWDLF
ncbi:uncharacterized protein EI90DRAFT_3023512 [Cantharellus anzutake]|uniref:uncharacterized protein n=1 Tax=Cantharellus anzutake TaxID=1750568 RepID=UPI00190793D3|nr:uncharacterized protein EI90DRAFT_3023512 [Cantharellus anzutake]KAF8311648.1 hypothetical protein EI90DRAFT_3023512 [Cantharellus anzutake]